jgi:hypothetical protein
MDLLGRTVAKIMASPRRHLNISEMDKFRDTKIGKLTAKNALSIILKDSRKVYSCLKCLSFKKEEEEEEKQRSKAPNKGVSI